MGLFSRKKAEPSFFETVIVANSEHGRGRLPGVWFQDLQMKPLQDSGIASKKLIENLGSNLFPIQGQGQLLVPENFEAKFDGVQLSSADSSPLREMFAAEFSGTQYHLSDEGVLTVPIEDGQEQNSKSTILSISFHKGKDGKEFGYVFVNLGFFTWPFSSDYTDLEVTDGGIGSIASAVNDFSTKVRAPIVMATLMAASEAAVLGANKNFYKAGRLGFTDKNRVELLPKPKFRVLPTYPVGGKKKHDGWNLKIGFMPQVLQVGWTFTAESLKDETANTILSNAPLMAYQLFADGCRNWPDFMDQVLGTPVSWASDLESGVLQVGDLVEFKKKFNYNGSPNSLAYSHWLQRLSEGKIRLSVLESALQGLSDEEEVIAEGNLSLANLMLGNFEKAEDLAMSVLKAEPENSEAAYVLESIARLANKPKLLEVAKKTKSLPDFDEYSPPKWLAEAVKTLAKGTKPTSSSAEVRISEELLEKLTEQFIEFVRVIDKLEVATVNDAEDLRPWVQITSAGSDEVTLVVGTPERIEFTDFPWFEPANSDPGYLCYVLPRKFFSDKPKVSSLLADVFESFNEIEIEIEASGNSVPRIKTLFSLKKPDLAAAAGVVAAATAGVAATTYTPKFLFAARTEEVQSEEPPSFDWF